MSIQTELVNRRIYAIIDIVKHAPTISVANINTEIISQIANAKKHASLISAARKSLWRFSYRFWLWWFWLRKSTTHLERLASDFCHLYAIEMPLMMHRVSSASNFNDMSAEFRVRRPTYMRLTAYLIRGEHIQLPNYRRILRKHIFHRICKATRRRHGELFWNNGLMMIDNDRSRYFLDCNHLQASQGYMWWRRVLFPWWAYQVPWYSYEVIAIIWMCFDDAKKMGVTNLSIDHLNVFLVR